AFIGRTNSTITDNNVESEEGQTNLTNVTSVEWREYVRTRKREWRESHLLVDCAFRLEISFDDECAHRLLHLVVQLLQVLRGSDHHDNRGTLVACSETEMLARGSEAVGAHLILAHGREVRVDVDRRHVSSENDESRLLLSDCLLNVSQTLAELILIFGCLLDEFVDLLGKLSISHRLCDGVGKSDESFIFLLVGGGSLSNSLLGERLLHFTLGSSHCVLP
ncbi:hypothetical protein PENTCL1PPCAC_23402, partial [Pristionchus entomophagus]